LEIVRRRVRESGFALLALMAALAIMLIMMAAVAPTWKYVAKREHEDELLFRGDQISRAIFFYRQKNAGALPASLELLVKQRYLRRLYKDPMTKDGKWRLIHLGEPLLPAAAASGQAERRTPAPTTSQLGPARSIGPIVGVASRSHEKSLALRKGRDRYDEWYFLADDHVPGVGTTPGGAGVPPRGLPTPAPAATAAPGP
jgi:type II secretory pathway pseudopilin PulG